MPNLSITVNGNHHSVNVEPDMPLLWVLRDTIGLTGTKFGCGEGFCGACMVLINGEATKSCSTPIKAVVNKDIITIEGLSADRSHPIQKKWIEEEVPQCGYCHSGQIITAAALLQQNNSPTDEDINNAMNGILCRCGTYQRIRRAIHGVAKKENGR